MQLLRKEMKSKRGNEMKQEIEDACDKTPKSSNSI